MEDLKHLLDLTYELEGLIELALRRSDAGDALLPLIAGKVEAIGVAVPKPAAPAAAPPVYEAEVPPVCNTEVPPVCNTEVPPVCDTEVPPPVKQHAEVAPPAVFGNLPLSINDKFRFRRELFGNNDRRYSRAMEIIATMTTMEEVRDYLCNDLELEEDSPEVQAFLERIKSIAAL